MAASHPSALVYGTVAVNPTSIATVTRGSIDVTIAGVAVGDLIVMYPAEAADDDLLYVGCRITAANTVRVYFYNPTAGPIDGASATWEYTYWDRT